MKWKYGQNWGDNEYMNKFCSETLMKRYFKTEMSG